MLLLLLGIVQIKRLAFVMPPGSKEIITALNSLFDTLNGRRKNLVEAAAGAGHKGRSRSKNRMKKHKKKDRHRSYSSSCDSSTVAVLK